MQSTISRILLFSLLLIVLLVAVAAAGTIDNRQFVERGIDTFSDSLILSLLVGYCDAVAIDSVAGPLGEALRQGLARRLNVQGLAGYLGSEEQDGKLLLQIYVNDYSLTYRNADAGLFRQGQVERVFALAGYGRTIQPGGEVQRAGGVTLVAVRDTLSFEQARAARAPGSLLSPELPPTLFQRVVEPGIVVSITGALVYLFFASR